MKVVAEEWSKTLSDDDRKTQYKNKKLIAQVKVMRDEEKKDQESESLASG